MSSKEPRNNMDAFPVVMTIWRCCVFFWGDVFPWRLAAVSWTQQLETATAGEDVESKDNNLDIMCVSSREDRCSFVGI